MAKKKTKSTKLVAPKRKTVPPIYPEPEPVNLSPRKIVDAKRDGDSIHITLEGPTPPELVALREIDERRFNLKDRLTDYCERCIQRMKPVWGKRPKRIPRSAWLDKKLVTPRGQVELVIPLPTDAPAEIRDAHLALISMRWIFRLLEAEGPISPLVRKAICMAIDLGQLLQRGQVQIDFGEAVDRGTRNIKSTADAKSARQRESQQKSAAAKAEFHRLMQTTRNPRHATATLKNMAAIKDADGKPKYGSLAQLKRYKRTWQ